MGDETPDIRLNPVFSGSNGHGELRDETLDIRISQMVRRALPGERRNPDISLRPVFAGSNEHGAER